MTSKRKILVTSALPYANGAIHLGHMVEHIQTDIWVRFQKSRGHECYYCCADDTHGTPIMLAAEKQGITPEQLIAKTHGEHLADFTGFSIGYDNYYSTHSPENQALSEQIYRSLKVNGKIVSKTINQLFDPEKQMFLPDRFVKGECPKCHAQDQYGDNCEVCGTTYAPTELIKPYSAVSGATPVMKETEHFFFKLSDCGDYLKQWTAGETNGRAHLQPEALNKMNEWLKEGELSDWDISRDAPYFGFQIPDVPNKYFYVWLDAPVGYMASFQNLCARKGLDFNEFFGKDSQTELYHFIGKDILYFHALFWTAMLEYSGHRAPSGIFAHGFLTVDGQKMSKSRGTFITARSYLEQGLNPEWMRYYIAAKLNSKIEDIDLNLQDFIARVNSDLVGKYVNIAARAAGFIHKRFSGSLKDVSGSSLIAQLTAQSESIAADFEAREYAKALREIMALADLVNKYVDANKPWEVTKFINYEFVNIILGDVFEEYSSLSSDLYEGDEIEWKSKPKHRKKAHDGLSQSNFGKPKSRKSYLVDLVNILNKDLNYPKQRLEKLDEFLVSFSDAYLIRELFNKFLVNRKNKEKNIKKYFKNIVNESFFDILKNAQYLDDLTAYGLKTLALRDTLHYLCSELINAFKILTVYLSPVLPNVATQAAAFLNVEKLTWADSTTTLPENRIINEYKHLMQRVEEKQVNDLIEANKQNIQAAAATQQPENGYEPVAPQCSFDDFMKVDMRVAKVLNCEAVEGSTKLLKFSLDFGFEQRTIFSGIAASYPNPAALNGTMVIAIANFAPRKMAKFGVSEGMILSAADKDGKLKLLTVHEGAQAGDKVG